MIDFPNAPVLGQGFATGGLAWQWDGVKWAVAGATAPLTTLIVTATAALPPGFAGFVRVENATSAAITVTLPVTPYVGQEITVKDTLGNASSYFITVAGGGRNIEGAPNLIISYNYSWVDLLYTGTQWVQV